MSFLITHFSPALHYFWAVLLRRKMLFPLAFRCKNGSKKQIENEEQHVPVLSKKGRLGSQFGRVTGGAWDCAKEGAKPKIAPGLKTRVVMAVGPGSLNVSLCLQTICFLP